MMDKRKKDFVSIDEYIKYYEDRFRAYIDMSPYGVQRETEIRMINELKQFKQRSV